jgi:uncharacterized protein involved in tellurium resistance
MSYYVGKVVKLMWNGSENNKPGCSTWQVLDVIDVDTNNDTNIHINLSHNNMRSTFLPITQITNYTDATTTISRWYDDQQHTEHWLAIK